jgi:peptidoglycan-N-acetylglucosamine deacetylase
MKLRLGAALLAAMLGLAGSAQAGSCPGNENALGTSRVIQLNPLEHRQLGLFDHGEALPLEDHEVVLTFDDGPIPPYTSKVLDALAAECVKANFFVVGQMAKAHPALLKREFAEGHVIGTHTEHHPHMRRLSDTEAGKEISGAIDSVNQVLGGQYAAPFFRFPYLEESRGKEGVALWLGLSTWTTDFHASDWAKITPEEVVARAMERLEHRGKGILMLHDIHDRTAKALPLMFEAFKKKGYKVVLVTPAKGEHLAEPAKAEHKEAAARTEAWPVEQTEK